MDNAHTVESLQSHCIHTQFHWSSGPPVCFPSWGTRVQSRGGRYLCETGILLLALSRNIGDAEVIDHCGLICGRLCPEPSLGHHANNVIIPLDLTQLSCLGFTLATGAPSGFTTNIVGCLGGALWRSCYLTAFIHSPSGPPVCFPSWGTWVQSPGGYYYETRILLLALSRYNTGKIDTYRYISFYFNNKSQSLKNTE